MHAIAVGKPYNEDRLQWPEEAFYQCRAGEHELVLFFNGITPGERQAVKKGKAEFGLLVRQPVIWLLFRFGNGVPWSDSPYTIHLVADPDQRKLPQDPHGKRAFLTTILVDAGTGITRAIRATTLSPDFSGMLYTAIRGQYAAKFDQEAYAAAVAEGYRLYPTTDDMLKGAAVIETGGAI